MVSAVSYLSDLFTSYHYVLTNVPPLLADIIRIFLFTLFIIGISVFIWFFYKTLSQKDFITLDLHKYTRSPNPGWKKFSAIMLYFLEHLIIMPVLILLWFGALAVILSLISEGQSARELLFLSAALVASIRMLSYSNQKLSEDLAKLFPFITLSVFLLNPDELTLLSLGERISEIPLVFNNVLAFILAVVAIEVVLRFFSTISEVWKQENESEVSSILNN